jgi:hypothetical protein
VERSADILGVVNRRRSAGVASRSQVPRESPTGRCAGCVTMPRFAGRETSICRQRGPHCRCWRSTVMVSTKLTETALTLIEISGGIRA